MWPFDRKKTDLELLDYEGPRPEPLSEFIAGRELDCLHRASVYLRLWLPEKAKDALAETADRFGESMTDYLTEFFVSYLYGTHELLRMRENATGLYYQPPNVRFCRMRTEDVIPALGKNLYAIAYSAESGHRFHAKADSHSKAKWTHSERSDAGFWVFTLKPPGLSILPVFCAGIRPPA